MGISKASQAVSSLILGFAAVVLLAGAASATPIGAANIANCSGGGVTVNATSITWLPVQGGGGCFNTGAGSLITYAGGTVGSGVTGTILNLTGGLPVDNFITFNGAAGLDFMLTLLGPGSGNTNCAALLAGQTCSAAAGSPFLLTLNAGGTSTVSLAATGIASDGTTPNSTWSAIFTTQVGLTPAQIQSIIGGGGAITNTYSTTLALVAGTTTPEPSSFLLFGLGSVLVGLGAHRRKVTRTI